MKVDVYNHERRYKRWKETVLAEGEPELSSRNGELLIQYVFDMEAGRNVSRRSRKGGRGYARLNTIRQRMSQLLRMLQDRGVSDVSKAPEQLVSDLFSDMDRGVITTSKGTPYQSASDYAKVFKAFWNWWMKVNRKRGITVHDITEDLCTTAHQPKFVYLTKDNLEALLPFFDERQQLLLLFLFDSMIRAPTEVLSLRARHVYESDGEVWVTVPDDVSKTFGRSFNLLYCGEALLRHIQRNHLSADDPLFVFSPPVMNRKLQAAASHVFQDRASHADGDIYRNLTLYDLRHSGAIHLRLLAKDNPGSISLDAIRHRAGWADFKMLNYYTRFIGLDGRIEKQGMLLRQDRHQLQDDIEEARKREERASEQVQKQAQANQRLRDEIERTREDMSVLQSQVQQLISMIKPTASVQP